MESKTGGNSYLFSFPFWIIVDSTSILEILEIEVNNYKVRFYPPFRSAPANYIASPTIDPLKIPFLDGVKVNISPDFKIPTIAAYPSLEWDSTGMTGLIPHWKDTWERDLKNFPMDSMRIDIISEDSTEQQATDIIQQLLINLRDVSFQWWIRYSVASLIGYLRSTFKSAENGQPLDLPYSTGTGATTTKLTLPINNKLWKNAILKLQEGYKPLLSYELYMDGLYFMAINDIRRAIIDFTIACEYAKDQTSKRLWEKKNGNKKYKRGKILSGNSLPVHLSQDFFKNFNYSYKVDRPKEFENIEELWKVRGNVAHGGELRFIRNGKTVFADHTQCRIFSDATLDCIEWLFSL